MATRAPCLAARFAISRASRDFPMPGSPIRMAQRPSPAIAATVACSSTLSSSSRPMSTGQASSPIRSVCSGTGGATTAWCKNLAPEPEGAAMPIDRVPAPGGLPFSTSVTVSGGGRWVMLAGQLGLDDDGRVDPGGGTAANIVRISAALTSLADAPDYLRAIGDAFGGDLPASTTVQVAGLLLGAHVEVDGIALIPG